MICQGQRRDVSYGNPDTLPRYLGVLEHYENSTYVRIILSSFYNEWKPLCNDNRTENKTIDNTLEAEKEFKKQYPAVYNHLSQFKKQLESRNAAETGIRYEWYALQRCAASYWQEFKNPKILMQGFM
jgi:hypothetical protein